MQVAVLSPHRDDAAFSCGLTLHNLLKAGSSLTIVNICNVSRYAPYFTLGVGDHTQQVTNLRRREDAEFVRRLLQAAASDGGQVEVVDLAWQDVPLRWRIEDHLALAPMSLRAEEIERLRIAHRELPAFDLVFVPMALGGHLDHKLVLQAALQAFLDSSKVFYEDLPYACGMSDSERTPALKLEIASIDAATGVAETREAQDFKRFATGYGLKTEDLNREFHAGREFYKLIGLSVNGKKYLFLG